MIPKTCVYEALVFVGIYTGYVMSMSEKGYTKKKILLIFDGWIGDTYVDFGCLLVWLDNFFFSSLSYRLFYDTFWDKTFSFEV